MSTTISVGICDPLVPQLLAVYFPAFVIKFFFLKSFFCGAIMTTESITLQER